MNEHATPWLGAYHDGELRGLRLRQVETHLAHCPACRTELERLQAMSVLLQESPAAEGLTPPDRFVAQVRLRLPRRPLEPTWKRVLEIGWRLVPVGLLGAGAFVRAVFLVSGVVLDVLQMGLGGDVIAKLLPASQQGPSLTELLGSSRASLSNVGHLVLQLLSHGGPLGWGVTLNVVALAVIGLLYWSWLASWWARRRHRTRILGHQRIG
ncbi:MAG: anti-sigma factor family protein [Anaerolineae bacterium]